MASDAGAPEAPPLAANASAKAISTVQQDKGDSSMAWRIITINESKARFQDGHGLKGRESKWNGQIMTSQVDAHNLARWLIETSRVDIAGVEEVD